MIEITEISSFVHNDVNYYLTIPTNYTYVFVNWKILRNRFRIHLQYLKVQMTLHYFLIYKIKDVLLLRDGKAFVN